MKRVIAILAALAALSFATPAPAAAASTGLVSHKCTALGARSGLNAGVCVDLYLYAAPGGYDLQARMVYLCNVGYTTIQCSGVVGLDAEYVSGYSYLPEDRYECGVYSSNPPTVCGPGRNNDIGVQSVIVPRGVYIARWQGRARSVTLNINGNLFHCTCYGEAYSART